MPAEISPELDQLMDRLLGSEKRRLFNLIGHPLPNSFRFNALTGETARQQTLLAEQGFRFQSIPGFNRFFRTSYEPHPLGKSFSHFAGHLYIQDLSSMLPALVLDAQPGETVLDLSAAPGSKTTQIAEIMQNRGVLVANDVVSRRIRSLATNLLRMGVVNTAVFQWYGQQFGNQYFERFDRVLLDPPCSGLGTLHKAPEILSWWSLKDTRRLARIQKTLMVSALKALRPGGVLVYATCTLTPEENEEMIDWALREFPVELEPVRLPGLPARPGLTRFEDRRFDARLDMSLRLYPFETESEGFFIARLRKTATLESGRRRPAPGKEPQRLPPLEAVTRRQLEELTRHFEIDAEVLDGYAFSQRRQVYCLSLELAAFELRTRPLNAGLPVAHLMKRGLELTTEGCRHFGVHARRNVVELPDLESLERFVNRLPLDLPQPPPGQVLVRYQGLTVGYGVSEKGRFKSRYPKGPWPIRLVNHREDKEHRD